MNRQVRSLVATALALVVMVSLLACSDTATPTVAPAAPTKAATTAAATAPAAAATAAPTAVPETIKVAFSIGLTAASGTRNGISSDRIFRMGVDDLNAQGGIKVAGKSYNLQAVVVDDKGLSEGGVESANRIVLSEKAKFMRIGGPSAGGAQPITEANKVVLFISGGQDQQLGPKFPYSLGGGYPHSRMTRPALYGYLAKAYPNAKRVAILYDDVITGQPYATLAADMAKSLGQTVVAQEFYPYATTKDFGPILTRVLAQNPDAIDIGPAGSFPASFAGIIAALKEKGYKGALFGFSGSLTTLTQAGTLADGYFFSGMSDLESPLLSAGEKDVLQRASKAYGGLDWFEPTSIGAYDTASLFAQAMVKANSVDDTTKIAQTLREGQWDTIWGKKGFSGVQTFGGLASYMDMNIYLSQFKGGKLSIIDSFNGKVP